MNYQKPALVQVGTAVHAIQAGLAKVPSLVIDSDNFQTDDAYQADE